MSQIYDIGITAVKDVLRRKRYKIFDNGSPNIVGIRNKNPNDTYDDRLFTFWKDNNIETIHTYTITTHPGYYYLQHPIKGTVGTAILVPGQYIDCWKLGMHRKLQYALCQRGGPVKVYRDSNKDIIFDYEELSIQIGYFGIDLHHGSLKNTNVIQKYSAGCQVWRYAEPHQNLMESYTDLSKKYKFKFFSYTLLREQDFYN